MTLAEADKFAAWWMKFLQPYSERLVVAGSIRRRRSVCNDIDIICDPLSHTETVPSGDMFHPNMQVLHNHAYEAMMKLAAEQQFKWKGRSETTPPPKPDCMYMWAVTPKCELDLWFAGPVTHATRLMCRTGSREHNIWICKRAERMGMKWNPYEGLFRLRGALAESVLIQAATEEELYAALDLPFIEPHLRELPYLVSTFGP